MLKRTSSRLLIGAMLVMLVGCRAPDRKYSSHFFDTFDTVVVFTAYAPSQQAFDDMAARVHARFWHLHKLYDIYHEYDGLNNAATLNRAAAEAPIPVDDDLMSLLLYAQAMQRERPGGVNIAMGAVLSLWHDSRERASADPESAVPPDRSALEDAARHTDMDDVILSTADRTVHFADPRLKLDLGAVAKGYATELVALELLAAGTPYFIINAGGNVRVGAPPPDGRAGWRVAIENPDPAGEALAVVEIHSTALVSSGDYQRYFEAGGVRYHHIIDPATLKPSDHATAVTILTPSSADADFYSTYAMVMPWEAARAAIEAAPDVDALWVLKDGRIEMTDGIRARIDPTRQPTASAVP